MVRDFRDKTSLFARPAFWSEIATPTVAMPLLHPDGSEASAQPALAEGINGGKISPLAQGGVERRRLLERSTWFTG